MCILHILDNERESDHLFIVSLLVSGMHFDDRPTCNYCICTVRSSVWVLLNCSRFLYSVHCTSTPVLYCSLSEIPLCTAQCSLWEPHQSVVNENSAAARRKQRSSSAFDRNKTPHSKTVQRKTGCDKHRQRAALRVEGGKTDRWRQEVLDQPVDLGVRQGMIPPPPLVLMTYPREKALFYLGNWLAYSRSRLIRGQVKRWNFFFLLR